MTPADTTKMFITFWGTRGSISTPGSSTEKYGGNTSCVSIRYGNTDIILDAGTGIRNFGLNLLEQSQQKNRKRLDLHLLLSHTHWDHIQGLPFFMPAYMNDVELTIYGSPKKESFLGAILEGQMDVNYFPVGINAFTANLSIVEISGKKMHIGPLSIDWQEQICHPGGSVRYRLNVAGKKVVYATDVELDMIFATDGDAQTKELARQYANFVRGADLLIADGQYTEDQYPSKTGWGHTSIPVIVDAAYRQHVRQLALFHHEPQNSDIMLDNLWSQYAPKYGSASPPMSIFWAREGMTLAI